jgi:ribosome-associated protein
VNGSSSDISINHRLKIPEAEIEWSYVRSSGPGGQNVNRTNSCAVLRWNYLASEALQASQPSESVLEKLQALATKDGDIIIKSQTFRDQERNYQECLTKFIQLLKSVYFKPKPRIATKPTKASKKRRLNNKKLHSEKKSLRQKRFD